MISETRVLWKSSEDEMPLISLVMDTDKVLIHPCSVNKAQLVELIQAASEARELMHAGRPAAAAESEGGA